MKSISHALLLGGFWVTAAQGVSVQENYTICNWARVRAGVIRDALYLDGGLLWWQTAFADGTTPVVSSDGNVAGDMFRLNFSFPFDTTSTNVSGLLERMPKAGGAGNNIAPNYVDGTMFTNDGELYLYGGLPRLTDSASSQGAQSVLGYEAYQYGPDRASWNPGFYQGSLSDGVTRYITNGGGVSASSENLGFYFSGMRSPSWGPIYYEDSSANVTANTLIQVDMSTMRSEKWSNSTIPDNIPPRANAELVWIPVSDKGVLVAIGGVTDPEEIWASGLTENQTLRSQAESPGFMTSLPVYDIATDQWYLQNTTGDAPGQLTEFCSVVASAKDSSSFNVYIYGGYNGLNAGDVPSDDVWILSIPSFQWVKAYEGTPSHGRSGHRCVMPYPDQMLVVGGIHQNQASCVEGGIVQVFNLNKLEFQNTYDPKKWSDYEVPAVVTEAIGGNAQGGSTRTASWGDDALGGIFSRAYSRQVAQYYPYDTASSPSTGGRTRGSGVAKGAIIGISVAAAVIFLLVLLLIILLVRRRRIIRSGSSEKSSSSSNSRVARWLNGAAWVPSPKHHQQSASASPPEVQQVPYTSLEEEPTPPLQPVRYEMASTDRPKPPYELATPYNSQDHPRHLGIVDYAYNADYGHTHSQSNSSDEAYRPSPLSNNSAANGNGHSNGNAAASRLRGVRFPPPAMDVSSPSQTGTTSSSDSGSENTLAWPFPATQNTWRGNHVSSHGHRGGRRYLDQHERGGSESSSVQPIMEEAEEAEHSRHGHTHELSADAADRLYHQPNESASSGIGTLPSPMYSGEGSLPPTEEARRSLFDTISPISPTMRRH